MCPRLKKIMVKLAGDRWVELRRKHSKEFMAQGPGPSWDRYKEKHSAEWEEIEMLQEWVALNGST